LRIGGEDAGERAQRRLAFHAGDGGRKT
jgi:hypothetical protein